MPTVESSIETALFAHAALLTVVPASQVAWPNKTLNPKPARYLRVTHIPNVKRRRMIRSQDPHDFRGILQIDVFTEKDKGASPATELAGQVVAHFPCDLELIDGTTVVRITKLPDIAQALPDDTHWMVPVMVEYETSG